MSETTIETTASRPRATGPTGTPTDRRWLILPVLCLSVFLVVVDNTIVNVALPTLNRHLGASITSLQWIVDAYSPAFAGLLLAGGGIGDRLGRAASLSYSFVVHVNPAQTVMQYSGDDHNDRLQWWIQEACFPRVEAGRAIVMSKIWSPQGVHVATEYQDGVLRPAPQPGADKGKL